MSKKVIITSNIIWTISNFRKDLIKALVTEGYEVVCVAAYDEFSPRSEKILTEAGARFISIELDRKGMNPLRDAFYLFRLYRLYRKERPEVVLHYTPKPNIYGTLASRLAGVPSINTVNGLGSGMMAGGTVAKIMRLMYRFSLGFSRRVFFQNRWDMEYFIGNGLVKEAVCRYVPGSGIDIREYDGCGKEHENGMELPIFLMVARLLKDKGVYEYIEACRRLKKDYPELRCLLGGMLDPGNPSAVREEELRKWIEEGTVDYLGKTEDIREFFRQGDVVVLPSYREGLSRLLLEAASCSKAIVTTDVPGCRDLVREEVSGYLCRPSDADSLVSAMEKMIESSGRLGRMGEEGRCYVREHFSKEVVNGIYLETVEEVCG